MSSRRRFLGEAALAGGAAMLSGTLTACASAMVRYQGRIADGRLRVPAAQVEALPKSGGVLVVAPGLTESIWLIRTDEEDGAGFLAIGSECTHLSCGVRLEDGFIRCRCHGSVFELDGSVIRGPATMPLRRYEVTTVAAASGAGHDVEILIP